MQNINQAKSFLLLSINRHLKKSLGKRESEGLLRYLPSQNNLIDFCSNDYLGFARSSELKEEIDGYVGTLHVGAQRKSRTQRVGATSLHTLSESPLITGSTGSRLLTGNSKFAEDLEAFIADYHNAEAGLLFNSGYDANTGLFSCVPQRGDTVIYDELIHASVRDGIRLGLANSFSFGHNDLSHLEMRLKKACLPKLQRRQAKGSVFVAVESVYSMDGDFSPLEEIVRLCAEHDAHLIVDEAHATGLFGRGGKGRVVELKLENLVFARIHTFGKALGCHGAIILGSNLLRDYLINFSRSFIYTTALPFHCLKAVKCAYDILSKDNDKILKLSTLANVFKLKIDSYSHIDKIESFSPIQCIIISGNDRVKRVAQGVQNSGFDVRPIMSPTVPEGKERLRICLHAFNTEEEVNDLVTAISENI